ncbi:conserved hypothetical protein [Candidatus Blochmanniella vafra str. BVAF]|uniref:Ubiquinone biosynthesis accessory factor UbiK n=1 Tax=Blochmanniella vafra (strain BVAF) TaxID=859654 RepID=E8Q6N4_BLOVB|nr:accessory factor UbiK family protein [Candidatus Blochmannia vafer]ADV33475.1 conserved hypothetical protein [Candidatus Blochmannia vafer str. BVAF]
MLDLKTIAKFTRYINEYVHKIISGLTCDLDSKIQQILQNQLDYMDFVNREEFDIQSQVLLEIQQKINELEKKVQILESIYQHKLKKNKSNNNT